MISSVSLELIVQVAVGEVDGSGRAIRPVKTTIGRRFRRDARDGRTKGVGGDPQRRQGLQQASSVIRVDSFESLSN